SLGAALFAIALCGSARADVVTEWNQKTQQALLTAKTSPIASSRALAIVQVAVFDAVNGIERRYTPIHVDFDAPPGASRRAAAFSRRDGRWPEASNPARLPARCRAAVRPHDHVGAQLSVAVPPIGAAGADERPVHG